MTGDICLTVFLQILLSDLLPDSTSTGPTRYSHARQSGQVYNLLSEVRRHAPAWLLQSIISLRNGSMRHFCSLFIRFSQLSRSGNFNRLLVLRFSFRLLVS